MKSKHQTLKNSKVITFFSKRTKFNLEEWLEEYKCSTSFITFRSLIERYLQYALEEAKLNKNDFNRKGLTIIELLLNWSSYLSRRIFFTASDYQQIRLLEEDIEKYIQQSLSLDFYFKKVFEKGDLLKEFNEETLALFEKNVRRIFERLFSETSNKYLFVAQPNDNQDKETQATIFYDAEEISLEQAKKANKILIDAILYKFLLIKCNQNKLNPEKIKNSLLVAKRLLGVSLSASDTDVLKYSLIQEFHYKFNELNKGYSFNKKEFRGFLKQEHCTDLFSGKEIRQISNGIQKQRELYLERENRDKNQFINEYIGRVRKQNTFSIAPVYPMDNARKVIKKVVIIGAGPIGLYLAALLAQKDTNLLDITVVEPRMGNYNRKKIISSVPIDSIQNNLGIDIHVSNDLPHGTMYIRDFEESLYKKIHSSKKIKWIKGWFFGFENNRVLIAKEKLELSSASIIEEIPCDIAFDCTGAKRVVLNGLNKYLNRDLFITTEIARNQFKFHCVTYITLPEKLINRTENPIHWAKQLKKLRDEYTWPCYGIPNIFINYVKLADGNYKYFFYYEIPSNLINVNREIHINWLYDLLSFHFDCHDLNSTDLVIDCHECFEVNPLMVKEKFYYGDDNTPAVLACGDAGIEPDYHLEFGIQSGMNRIDCLVKAIKFNHDNEQAILHFDEYVCLVEKYIEYHKLEIEQLYITRKENINRWLIEFTEKINLVIDTIVQPEDRFLLMSCLKEVGEEHIKKNRYHEAINCYSISLSFYARHQVHFIEDPAFIKCNALIKTLQEINFSNNTSDAYHLIEELKENFEIIQLNSNNSDESRKSSLKTFN